MPSLRDFQRAATVSSTPWMPVGMNIVVRMKMIPTSPYQCTVCELSVSFSTSKAATPMAGPYSVPAPPSNVMITMSPEVLQCRPCGLTNCISAPSNAPATPL